MNIVITDCEYRAAVSLVQSLGKAGHKLFLCHSSDMKIKPPAFYSRFAAECFEIPHPVDSEEYIHGLENICKKVGDMPVLLPAGAKTTALIAKNKSRFDGFCKTLIPDEKALDTANDKAEVAKAALALGIAVPRAYSGEPDRFPVIVKPHCGEKFGLHAEKRYIKANNKEEYIKALDIMKKYGEPIVQEFIPGGGVGVSVVMDKNKMPACIFCHRRVRQYPIAGGPSTCCEAFYDEALAASAVKLLQHIGFVGVAMVEFRGDGENGYRLLEINPRIWGSFPLTLAAESRFSENMALAAEGACFGIPDCSYKRGRRMNFLLSDGAACLALIKAGRVREFFGGIRDILSPSVKEALCMNGDMKPFWRYIKNTLFK